MLKALFVAAALFAATPALAQTAADVDQQIDTVLGPHETYATAIARIQEALKERDVEKLAGYIAYGEPLKVNGADVVIADETQLTAEFNSLFNQKVTDAVVNQTYETLFVNQDGIMFGDGELWLNGVCDDEACEFPFVTIIAINNQ